jgi:hypothetical protein
MVHPARLDGCAAHRDAPHPAEPSWWHMSAESETHARCSITIQAGLVGLEMTSIAVFLFAVLTYAARSIGDVHLGRSVPDARAREVRWSHVVGTVRDRTSLGS